MLKDANKEEMPQEFTFTGTLIEGPDVDLVKLSGLRLTDAEEEMLWDEIDRRHFLIDNDLCEEIELEGEEDESDIPGMSDSVYEYRCGAKNEFVARLRSAILKELDRVTKQHATRNRRRSASSSVKVTSRPASIPPSVLRLVKGSEGVQLTVSWGNDVEVSLRLTPRNWSRLQRGQSLRIRGKGYIYEGEFFWDYWTFTGGVAGDLSVEYGEDAGVGFVGKFTDAKIRVLTSKER
jgi:hypothetical protein